MASKYIRDLATVTTLLEKKTLTNAEKLLLLTCYNVSYHDSGKIEGIASFDGSAISCEFCNNMRKAAESDSTIVCGDCYAAALDSFRTGCEARHWLNQQIMKNVLFTVSQLKTLCIPSNIARFNSDGDFDNVTQAQNAFRTCKAFPRVKFALWTKNLPALKAAYDKEGKPRNLVIVYSSCRVNESRADILRKYPFIDYVFTVYADKESTEKAIAQGANECNGKKCRACGFKCYLGTWEKNTDIAEYLRGINKEKRAAILAAIAKRAEKRG